MGESRHRVEAVIVLDVPPRPADPRAARIDDLVQLHRLRCWLDAQEQRILAEIAADPGDTPEWMSKNLAREEVACALRIPGWLAEAKLATATDLVERCPATLRALDAGDISLMHARVLTDAATGLDQDTAAQLEAAVLPRAAQQTAAGFRRSVTRARARLAPKDCEQRHSDAVAERRVQARPLPDGMGQLSSTITADDLAAVTDVLNAEAHRLADAGDQRTIGQLRADCLVDRILGRANPAGPTGGGPDRTGAAGGCTSTGGAGGRVGSGGAAVQVTIALSTLTGLDDQPGELVGYGPIPASMARRIAAEPDAVWRRLVTDELGRLVDYGRSTYRPPAGLADFVRLGPTLRIPHLPPPR